MTFARRLGRGRGLTLVELMVAIGLGSILIGVITFVWLQSNKIFSSTLNRLEAYQRLRIVLDQMERDLANTNRTVDMEWFQDGNSNGHFDSGEPLLPTGSTGYGSPTAPAWRAPVDPSDPLVIAGQPEFNQSDAWNAGGTGINNHPYFFGPVVFSPSPYEITNDDYLTVRSFWRDEVYVRTFSMADGINRPAMVHYRLVAQADGRSALRRRIWYLNEQGQILGPGAAVPTDRTSILATGLCDLKIGFYFKESASSVSSENGKWYHVGRHASDTATLHQNLADADEQAGFISARYGRPPIPPGEPPLSQAHAVNDQFIPGTTGTNDWNAVSFFYKGFMRVHLVEGKVFLNPIDNLTVDQPSITNYTQFDFPGVRPGDKVFVFQANDDDTQTLAGGPGDVAGNGPTSPFPDQVFTVESIISNGGASGAQYVALKVQEPISFPRLQRRWLGVETAYPYKPFDDPRPTQRQVDASFNCGYRIGFLPAAFRVRLTMDDKYNKKVLPMERVIRLIQQ